MIQKQVPTTRSPVSVTLPFFFDPSLSWYSGVVTLSDTTALAGFRASFPNGSKLVANSYWSIRKVPTVEDSTLRSEVVLAFSADPIVYAT